MNRKATLIVAMLALAGMAFAAPVDHARTARMAHDFWLAMGGKPSASLHATPWQYPLLRLYTAEGGGFVIVAADDVARPVLGYSTSSHIDPSDLPLPLAGWLQSYQDEIALAVEAQLPASPLWLEAAGIKGERFDPVGPLCSTRWTQDAPFNTYTPARTPVGCAATMQAQVMKYWNYPAFGHGAHNYDCPSYGPQAADFSHTLYRWDLMPDRANYASPADVSQALGTLLYHIGVSLEMRYNHSGSGTQGFAGFPGVVSNDNSLIDHFYFKPTLEVKDKSQYDNDSWRDMLIEELAHLRPIPYMGTDPEGGHAFVCDGNDSLGFLHFNMGWAGDGDGYYAIGAINPGVGNTGQFGDYHFNDNNMAIIKLEPDYTLRLSDSLLSLPPTAGTDSVLMATNDTLDAPWTVDVDADWVRVARGSFDHAGWVVFSYDANTSTTERVATATFSQAGQQATLLLMQPSGDTSGYCRLTVVMESTRNNGWQGGAHLTLESPSGYVYGTAALANGSTGRVQISVPDSDVKAVWHSGGGSDRYVNYRILDPSGREVVTVEYAYTYGGTHVIETPCSGARVALSPIEALSARPYPNPTTGLLHLAADAERIEMYDLAGRRVATYAPCSRALDLGSLPAGTYLLRLTTANATSAHRIVVQ